MDRISMILIGMIVILVQIVIFKDYISPIQWGQVKVRGLACTCPDEKVISGRFYLRSITHEQNHLSNIISRKEML